MRLDQPRFWAASTETWGIQVDMNARTRGGRVGRERYSQVGRRPNGDNTKETENQAEEHSGRKMVNGKTRRRAGNGEIDVKRSGLAGIGGQATGQAER